MVSGPHQCGPGPIPNLCRVIGVGFGAAIVQEIRDQGIGLQIPVVQLVLFVVLSAFAGLLAGWLPARRAAHLDVLLAINTE